MDLPTRYSFWIIVVVLLASASAPTTLAQSTPTQTQCNYTLTMYLHDNLLTVNNASAFVLTLPVGPGYFGTFVDFDDLLTISPDPISYVFGRGRGLYLFDANDNNGPATQMVWTVIFDFQIDPSFANGPASAQTATITLAGFDRQTDATSEISVIGGTGRFRSASGYAEVSTYSRSGFATVWEITIFITYPENIGCVPRFFCCPPF